MTTKEVVVSQNLRAARMPAENLNAKPPSNVLDLTFDLAKNTEDDAVKLAAAVLASPIATMVVAVAAIELLQGVMVFKGRYGWQQQIGAHGQWYGPIKEPLIGQGFATTMETTIVTAETLKSLGGLGDIGTLIARFIK